MTENLLKQEVLQKLASYDTPTICNVIEIFEVRPRNAGYMNGHIRAAFPEMPPMIGFAATASFRAAEPSSGGNIYEMIEAQLEQISQLPGPAVVVFQDLDEPSVGATFGEVMCSSYQAFGSAGLITSGGGRDLDQVRALKYPVFTGTTICSHSYSHILSIGEVVEVGGLMIQTGDLLHGDANGVTSIPMEVAGEIVDVADEYIAAEAQVMEYAQSPGTKSITELVNRRRAMSAAIAELRARVSRKT